MLDRRVAGFPGTVVHAPPALDAAMGLDGHHGSRAANCLRQPCQPYARPWFQPRQGNRRSFGNGCHAVAHWADRALMKIYLPSDSGGMNISSAPDLRILLFNLAVTVLTGVIFGLVPALQTTKPNIAGTLKDQAGAVVGGSGHNRLRKTLVIAQVTLSLLLLVGAGLFVRSLANLRNLGPGFSPERLVGFQIDPSLNGYTPERLKVFYPQLSDALASIPGVQSVGLAAMRILEDNEWDSSMSVEGFSPAKPDEHAEPYMNSISPGYFA